MRATSELTKLGSPSALSLFADAGSTPSLVAAGAVMAVSAAVFVYSEISGAIAKKHKEKIERINALHAQHLKNILVPNRGKIHGFPAIFQLVEEKYQSMSFTPEQIKDIGSAVAHGTDVSLSSYRESVQTAIRKLQEFYFARVKGKRVKSDDITASVLAYLMHMLDSKCLNFLGYDYDIAYLDAICKFINAYSSEGNGEKSRRFSRLGPVYSHLLKAKQKLEKHREVLSLQDTVAELKDSCVSHSSKLIRMLVKMVVRDDDTELADTVAHEELQAGILRQHYVHTEIKGLELQSDKEIKIPESIFREWIKNLSEYYLRSLSIESGEDETSVSPNSFFSFLDEAEQVLSQKSLIPSKAQVKVERELGYIRSVFKDSGNFISSRYNKKNKKFEIVSKPEELIERSRVMAFVARLAHEIISLQYLCTHLLKSIQLLGDIYVRNPAHFSQIFQVLERLCALIKEEVKTTKAAFTALQQDNQNNMQIQEKEDFPNQIRALLDSVRAEIKALGDQVKECRQMAIKEIPEQTAGKVKYEMLEMAMNISEIYFPTELLEPVLEDAKLNNPPKEVAPSVPALPAVLEKKPSETALSSSKQIEPSRPITDAERLAQLAADMQNRITDIQNAEPQRAARYLAMRDALLTLKNRAVQTRNMGQGDKPTKVLALTASLFEDTLTFLQRSQVERQARSGAFFNDIHQRVTSLENSAFIDYHSNDFSRFLYRHLCSQSIFRTQTRRKLADFEEACFQATH